MKKLFSVLLTMLMIISAFALPVSATEVSQQNNTVYANGKVWFDLKGNSRLFVPSTDEAITNRGTYENYLPGVDFAGFVEKPTGDFAKDQETVTNPAYGGAMFVYNAGGSTSYVNLTTDEAGNYYWTVNDEKYLVRPQQNILKFVNKTVSTSSILTDSEKTSRYQSLNGEKTIDVPDGKYSSIGFLGGAKLKFSKQIKVTLVYGDEEIEYGNITHKYGKTSVSGTDGTMYMRNFTNSNSLSDAAHDFQVQIIPTEPTKVLTAIKVYDVGLNGSGNSGNQKYPYYIISVWGNQTIEGALSAVSASTSKKEAKAILSTVDAALAENGITADDLTDETKAKYELAKVIASALEVTAVSYENAKVTVSYMTGADTNAKIIVAEYDDEEESLFKKVTIIPAELTADKTSYEAAHTATGTKVKVFVWKDMINFFPYH